MGMHTVRFCLKPVLLAAMAGNLTDAALTLMAETMAPTHMAYFWEQCAQAELERFAAISGNPTGSFLRAAAAVVSAPHARHDLAGGQRRRRRWRGQHQRGGGWAREHRCGHGGRLAGALSTRLLLSGARAP